MTVIDLHMHSKWSLDGEYSSKEIINLCERAGLKTISITDHNSVEAIDECLYYAKKIGIKLIPGIEIDCFYKETNLHLLGYNIDYKSRLFHDLYRSLFEQEALVSLERIKKINELGFYLTIEDFPRLKNNFIVTPEEIAEVLLNKNYAAKHELLTPYLPGGHRSDNPYVNFYWDYFSKGKTCYVDMEFPSIEEALALVINNGGIPIIAHPGVTFRDNYEQIDEIIALGVQGIEAFSSYHNRKECKLFYNMAKENRLIITAGSDFHGKNKPSVKLGNTNYTFSDEELLKEMNSLLNY
ncbi:PHP domain-containing protein [Clostridium sediminicola]|uniref:PHP domain-containing protein n=1 Tax=Clostridium sediminicola TaxID=3114879 RepID=UPI0031F1D3AA